MVLGLFSSKKSTQDKAIEKAKKLAGQSRWAEALSWFEDAADEGELPPESAQALYDCREKLVEVNLEEARGFMNFDMGKAAEHCALALKLAGPEKDLAKKARELLATLESETPAPKSVHTKPKRLFEPSCGGCASPDCADDDGPLPEEHPEDLFWFYLESLAEDEQQLLEELGEDYRRGFVLLQQGELKEAKAAFDSAPEEEACVLASVYVTALWAAVSGKTTRAVKLYDEVLEALPEFGSAIHHKAGSLIDVNKMKDALATLEPWLANNPADLVGRVMGATCYMGLKNPEAALELMEREGVKNETMHREPQAMMVLAAAKRDTGDMDGAIATLKMLVAKTPEFVSAAVALAELLMAKGGKEGEESLKLYKHCVRIDPENSWAHLLNAAKASNALGWDEETASLLEEAQVRLPADKRARAMWERIAKEVG